MSKCQLNGSPLRCGEKSGSAVGILQLANVQRHGTLFIEPPGCPPDLYYLITSAQFVVILNLVVYHKVPEPYRAICAEENLRQQLRV